MIARLFRQYRQTYSGLPREAWLLSLVVFVNRSGTMILFFLTLYLTTQLDFTVQLAGQMVSVYGAGSLGGALLGGWLTDRWGAARVQFLSLVLGGLVYISLAYAEQLIVIMASLFVAALLNESFRPANATAFAEVCPPQMRAKGFALNRLAINLGMTIGPAAGGFLAVISYTYIFWVDGITCIAAAIVFWFLLLRKQRIKTNSAPESNVIIRSPWKDSIFISAMGLLLMTGILFTQVFNTWPLFLRTVYRLIEDQIGLLIAVNAVMVALFEMPLVHHIQKFNTLRITAIGAFLLFFGFAILPLGSGFAFGFIAVVIWTLGEILVFPLMGGFVANRAGDTNRGKYMGMFSFTFALSFVIGPSLGAIIYDQFGPQTLWFAFGVTGIIVALGFERLRILESREQAAKNRTE